MSYKYLKDISTIDASDRFNIDVVFEIDELSLATASGGTTTYGSVEFFEQENESTRRPVSVKEEVYFRCKKFIDEYASMVARNQPSAKQGFGGKLSAKAVSAKRGVALFSYRKFLRLAGSGGDTEASRGTVDLYFPSQGGYAYAPPPPPESPIEKHLRGHRTSRKFLSAGSAIAGISAALYLIAYAVDQTAEGESGFAVVTGGLGVAGMVGGGAMALGGGGGMIGHKLAAEKKLQEQSASYQLPPPPPPVFPGAEGVMCAVENVTPPWLVPDAPVRPRVDEKSSSVYTFEDSERTGVSAEAKGEQMRQQMSRKIAADMFDEIEKHL